MNGLYDILLFLFILGAVSQGVNEMGFFNQNIPDAGVTLGDSTVTEIHSSALSQSTNEFNWIEVIKSFMRVIGAGILAMFTIIPMIVGFMQAVGVDYNLALLMAGILQAPITFVTLFGLYEFWTGRATT
jgi:hypothetical protein